MAREPAAVVVSGVTWTSASSRRRDHRQRRRDFHGKGLRTHVDGEVEGLGRLTDHIVTGPTANREFRGIRTPKR